MAEASDELTAASPPGNQPETGRDDGPPRRVVWRMAATSDLPLWALSRRSDPKSSSAAVAELASTGNLGRQEQEVYAALERFAPCTSKELAERSGLCRYACARRLSGLLHKGRVVRSEQPKGDCVWEIKLEN